MFYSFWHDAKPKVKERPRSGKVGGRKLYTPKATLDAEASLAAAYEGPRFEGPVGMHICLFRNNTFVSLWDSGGGRSGLHGDLDNYAKLVMDGLQGVAYSNDKQVESLTVMFGTDSERDEVR